MKLKSPKDIIEKIAVKREKILREGYLPKHVIIWNYYGESLIYYHPYTITTNDNIPKTIFGMDIIYTEIPEVIEVY